MREGLGLNRDLKVSFLDLRSVSLNFDVEKKEYSVGLDLLKVEKPLLRLSLKTPLTEVAL
ncbi:MAG: hypothetical protein ACP5QT_03555 [Brevinematia bacterium]